MNSARSWLVFGVGVFAYLVAVMERSTIGVAGVAATERFHSPASVLSALAVLQLVVYAVMQVPVGVLLDRVGARVLMLGGTALMAIGQLCVALAPSIGIAVAGRVLVGAGDAAIFISLIRLVNSWFRGRMVPQLSQWVGNIGQLGQVLSAVPFALILHQAGWMPAFLSAASVSVLGFIGIAVAISNRPHGTAEAPPPASWAESMTQLGASLRRPGTQLGFWSHFTTQSSGTVFSLMWGYPFMVFGLGYSPELASSLLIVIVVAGMIVGPILGVLTARHPLRRSNIVIGILFAMGVAWTVVLAWPGQPPLWLIVALLVVVGAGGPGSLIGFDFARTFNPLRSLGSANGIVNVGGFLASFVMMYLIGVLLDLQNSIHMHAGSASDLYSLNAFRVAFLIQYVVIGAGTVMLLIARRRTRRRMAEDEGIEVAPLWVALSEAWARRRS